MSKKSKYGKRSASRRPGVGKALVPAQEIERWMRQATNHLVDGNYEGAVGACKRVLAVLSPRDPQRAEALRYLAVAQSMLQHFPESYTAYTEALALAPGDAELWYNRGLVCRFTGRLGQSLRDLERAMELDRTGELGGRPAEELRVSRRLADESAVLRGRAFTLDQLIEQEERFQRAIALMEARRWPLAEQEFRQVIAMGDCLPQPWGNLGVCLLMQRRFDEAETALKRAIEMDPEYEIARRNLAAVPESRRTGRPTLAGIIEPFKGTPIKQSLTFHTEES